jgi:regulator of replication initiation timing
LTHSVNRERPLRAESQVRVGSAFFVSPHYAMSAIDTAKEVVRIASTAGLDKDVIDLMEKKIALLTGEIGDLTQKNTVLSTKVSSLEIENVQLRTLLGKPQPVGLDDPSTKMLQAIAKAPDGAKKEDLFAHFGLSLAKGDFHFDQLITHKFIRQTSVNMYTGILWGATPAGREYLNQKGLL